MFPDYHYRIRFDCATNLYVVEEGTTSWDDRTPSFWEPITSAPRWRRNLPPVVPFTTLVAAQEWFQEVYPGSGIEVCDQPSE